MVMGMTLLTRDQILQAQDIARETVSVPEWGGSVLVRGLTGQERDAYEATIMRLNGTNAQMNLVNSWRGPSSTMTAIGCSAMTMWRYWQRKARRRWSAFSILRSV